MKTKNNKNSAAAAAPPLTAPARAPRRAATTVTRQSKALRSASGIAGRKAVSTKAGSPAAAAPAQGTIRLDLSSITVNALLGLVHRIRDGLNGNIYYPDLTGEVTALTAAENGLLALLDTVASLDQQLKTIRAALDTEVLNVKDIVRAVAISCENEDRSDEALVSVGWELRKGRTPSKPVASPTRLTVSSTAFAGTVVARWRRVPTAKFYEVQSQALPASRAAGPITWEESVTNIPSTRVTQDLSGFDPGSLVSVRIRAVGSKGPSPWCDALTARA